MADDLATRIVHFRRREDRGTGLRMLLDDLLEDQRSRVVELSAAVVDEWLESKELTLVPWQRAKMDELKRGE